MSRINRRLWTEDMLDIKSSGSLHTLFDNAVKGTFRLTDKEYDQLLEDVPEKEQDFLMNEHHTFSEKRYIIDTLNKYIKY